MDEKELENDPISIDRTKNGQKEPMSGPMDHHTSLSMSLHKVFARPQDELRRNQPHISVIFNSLKKFIRDS